MSFKRPVRDLVSNHVLNHIYYTVYYTVAKSVWSSGHSGVRLDVSKSVYLGVNNGIWYAVRHPSTLNVKRVTS